MIAFHNLALKSALAVAACVASPFSVASHTHPLWALKRADPIPGVSAPQHRLPIFTARDEKHPVRGHARVFEVHDRSGVSVTDERDLGHDVRLGESRERRARGGVTPEDARSEWAWE